MVQETSFIGCRESDICKGFPTASRRKMAQFFALEYPQEELTSQSPAPGVGSGSRIPAESGTSTKTKAVLQALPKALFVE